MNDISQHDEEWNDRLQDLLDGDVIGSERASLESHVAGCARCRAQFAKLKKLDTLLNSKIDPPVLSGSFDQQVFARINANDAQARERARLRVDRELQDNLELLARGWRRGLLSLIGGAVAGLALAMAFITWVDKTGLTDVVVGVASSRVGGTDAGSLHFLVTAIIGAAIGAVVSRWMVSTVE